MCHVSTEGTRPITQLPATRVLFFTEVLRYNVTPKDLLSRDFSGNAELSAFSIFG
jgi:hypothetical protein